MDSIFEGSDVGDSDGDEMCSTNGDSEYEQDEIYDTCVVCNKLFNPHFVIGEVYLNGCCSEQCEQYQEEGGADKAAASAQEQALDQLGREWRRWRRSAGQPSCHSHRHSRCQRGNRRRDQKGCRSHEEGRGQMEREFPRFTL